MKATAIPRSYPGSARRSSSLTWRAGTTLAYGFTAIAAALVAYDPHAAGSRIGLILAGLALMLLLAWAGRRWRGDALGPVALACAALAAGVGVYYLLGADRQPPAGKLPALQHFVSWVTLRLPSFALPEDIHPNVAGSLLAILLPLGAGGCAWAWHKRLRGVALVAALALLVAAAAAFLTVSRGAWMGLAAAAVVAGWYGRRVRALPSTRDARLGLAAIIAAVAVLSLPVLLAMIHVPVADRLLGGVSLGSSVVSRTAVWRDALVLIGDYPFTGSGLGSTAMVYSTYVLLIHDPYLNHAHSLLLQTTVEQGIAGGALFAAMVGSAFWAVLVERRARPQRAPANALRVAVLASLTALVVHGAIDGGLYASKAALLLFAPLGMAYGLARERSASPESGAGWVKPALFILAALLAALLLLPAVRAAAQANLGALAQTRSELAAYRWPEVPLQDVLRRPGGVDLSVAEARFRAVLALNPENVTANRRLGQIALANEERAAARRYLDAAYAGRPGERPTRQMLGELAALSGDTVLAADLWRGIEFAGSGLQVRKWWYASYLGQPEAAEALRQAEVTLDDRS